MHNANTKNTNEETNQNALTTLQKLAKGEAITSGETTAFQNAIIRPACFSNGAARCEIEEGLQMGWAALLKPVGTSGITPCGKVWAMLCRAELSESEVISYLRTAVHNAIGASERRMAMGRLHAAVKSALGNTAGYFSAEDGLKRSFYAPAYGHRWQMAGDHLNIKAVAKEIAEHLEIMPHGSLPKKLRATILPILRASFDLLELRLRAGQLTNIVAEALGLGGLGGQPISIDQSKGEEDGGVGLEAKVSSAWEVQNGMDDPLPEDATVEDAEALADKFEAHWQQHDGQTLSLAIQKLRKGSDAPALAALLSGAKLEDMARYYGSGVSSMQERIASRGLAPRKLIHDLEKWETSGCSNRQRFTVPPKLAALLGPLMDAPHVARAAWDVLRRRNAEVIAKLKRAA